MKTGINGTTDNTLTTEDEINKAIAAELGEDIIKAVGDGDTDTEEEEGDKKKEGGSSDTNAKVEGEKKEEEEEDETEKGKGAEVEKEDDKKKKEGEEMSEEEVEKAIDASPILKSFQERQNAIESKVDQLLAAVGTMRKNNAVMMKGMLERVGDIDSISKAVEEIHAFGAGRKTFSSEPLERFNKGVGGEDVQAIDPKQHRDIIIKAMEQVIWDENGNVKHGVAEKGLIGDMKNFVAGGVMTKGLWQTEFAKAGFVIQNR